MFPRQYVILRQDGASSSSSRVLSEGSVWRGHPDGEREGEGISLSFMMLLSLMSFIRPDLMIPANVVDILFRILQSSGFFVVAPSPVFQSPPFFWCISPCCTCIFLLGFYRTDTLTSLSSLYINISHAMCSLPFFLCAWTVSPPCLSLSRFLCLCLAAGVFLKNNKVWGCACACASCAGCTVLASCVVPRQTLWFIQLKAEEHDPQWPQRESCTWV